MSDTFAVMQTLVRNGEIKISEKLMRKRLHSRLIHEGQYVAEVDVELIEPAAKGAQAGELKYSM